MANEKSKEVINRINDCAIIYLTYKTACVAHNGCSECPFNNINDRCFDAFLSCFKLYFNSVESNHELNLEKLDSFNNAMSDILHFYKEG